MKTRKLTILSAMVLFAATLLVMPLGRAQAATEQEIVDSIDMGLAYLANAQNADGSWTTANCDKIGPTGLVLLKFEDYAIEMGFDDPTDDAYMYGDVVQAGLDYLMMHVHQVDISAKPECDGDDDGFGVIINNCPGTHDTYNTAIALMALTSSQLPGIYGDTAQDAADWLCYAQYGDECQASGPDHIGGWDYTANNLCDADNSNSGWATIALGAAAGPAPKGFDIPIPKIVTDRLDGLVDRLQDPVNGDADDGGSEYKPGNNAAHDWENILKTGNLLYQMAMVGDTVGTQRVKDAIDYIERHWNDPGGGTNADGWKDHRQAMFTMMKGFESLEIEMIDLDNDNVPETEWFDVVADHLVQTQNPDGSWPRDPWTSYLEVSTAWALLTLERTVTPPPPPCKIYVDASATGANDGSSWDDAYNYLQDALWAAEEGCVIWVAQGTYYPDRYTSPEPPCPPCEPEDECERDMSFMLKNGVRIIGGFVGNTKDATCCRDVDRDEKELNINCCCPCEEDGTAQPDMNPCGCCKTKCVGRTILCGNICDPNIMTDNSYHVVDASGTDETAVLENVVIRDGYADGNDPNHNGGGILNIGGNPTLKYVCVINNYASDSGGGMYNGMGASPTIISSSFCDNKATWGGAIANYAWSSPEIVNTVFRDNEAEETGGAVNNTMLSDPRLVNCTLYMNSATAIGGGIYSNGSDPLIQNSILWMNDAPLGPQIAQVANNRRTHVSFCNIQGGKDDVYDVNATFDWLDDTIMDQEPNFVDPDNCNLRLRTNSPCLDAANNWLLTGYEYDRDGNDRFVDLPAAVAQPDFGVGVGDLADLGAFERPAVRYVNVNSPAAPADQDGAGWDTAFMYLQDALMTAEPHEEIWVAAGEYTPDDFKDIPNLNNHPEIPFQLINNVVLMGGFDGSETDISDRNCDPRANETVLSGDLFDNDDYANPFNSTFFENSWNVVMAGGSINGSAVLDGFTVRGGYANGTSQFTPWNKGGGMHNLGSPTINCCWFDTNWAYDQGGAMYNEGNPVITNTEFSGNYTRQQGAGICNIGGDMTIDCCQFNYNVGSKLGGGMYNEDGSVVMTYSSFTGNGSAHQTGGGMANVATALLLCNNSFYENTADQDGGAMHNMECADMKLYQNKFSGNTAEDDGGAMFNALCPNMLIVNGVYLDNKALSGWGGAMHNMGCDDAEIINCTFTRNEADEGGAIYNGYGSPITILNSILWGDSAPLGPEISLEECDLTIRYCVAQGGEPAIQVWGNVFINRKNLSTADPLFADADGRLSHASTALHSGNNDYIPACVMYDIDGSPRIYETVNPDQYVVDLGAYEAPYNCCTTCLGDADGDNYVGFADMMAVFAELKKNAPYYYFEASDNTECWDMDADGWVGMKDLMDLYLGLREYAPYFYYQCP